jgi:hypothetical protein
VCTRNAAEDAQLILAAPDLLAALMDTVQQIEYMHEKFRETGTGNQILARAYAAIAKARGEQPEPDAPDPADLGREYAESLRDNGPE